MHTPKNIIASVVIALCTAVVLLTISCSFLSHKKYIIAYINPNPTEFEGAQGFLENLPKYGFVEGGNTTILRCETKDRGEIEKFIKRMVAQKVDLIFTMTTPATKMAKELTKNTGIPVLFIIYDAIGAGIVDNLLEPKANLTGIQLCGSTPKSLEKLLEISPAAKHIFTPVCFDTGAAKRSLEDLEEGVKQLGMQLTVGEVNNLEELETAMTSMPSDIDALFIVHTWLVGTHLEPVIAEAVKRKIPLFSAGHVHFDNGLLFSYGPLNSQTGRQVARQADYILNHGVPPTEIPVETSDFFLGINLKTARAASIEIPYNMLQQADFILR
jgi:putative tryptophan/tyrosine transport system substrate-binding protein